jgi:hypothetical protein
MADPATVNPPVSKKVISGLLAAGVAAVLQAIIPGYNPDPLVASLITAAVGSGTAFIVREELKYLVPATKAAKQ